MKKLFALIIGIIASNVANAQWTWQNPIPTSNSLQSVCFTDANTGYAVGEMGTIIKTIDGGITWTSLSSGTGYPLYSIYFTDADTGYAVGETILKTTNAGATWVDLTHGTYRGYSVFFTDANTGFVVGYETLIKTTDGGTTWVDLTQGIYSGSSVFFTDSNTGYAVGETILKTTDAGATWVDLTHKTFGGASVFFTDANTGFVVGYETILKTTDGGTTWNIVSSEAMRNLKSVFFTDANTGFAVGSEHCSDGEYCSAGIILKTSNGGMTWNVLSSEKNEWLNSIYFSDANTGFIVGFRKNGIIGIIKKTIDGGTTWTELTSDITTAGLSSVCFPDANTGYAVGSNGTIVKTINGGSHWDSLSSGTANHLASVFCTDANTAYTVGNNGTILKTKNGGSSWSTLSGGTTEELRSVYFPEASTGYVVGGCSILKTTDGGTTWNIVSNETNKELYSVYFTNHNTGYVVGINWDYPSVGIIKKTSDGGITWTEVSGEEREFPNSICFTDDNTGYAVGSYSESYNGLWTYGFILKTIDGGTTWTKLPFIANGYYLRSVYFSDANTGYAVGGSFGGRWWGSGPHSSIIIKTTDGGVTWTELSNGTYFGLSSVYFPDENTGYAVGEWGTILKTTNGGGFVGINNAPARTSRIKIYPNPSSTQITIETPEALHLSQLSIINLNGQQIKHRQITEPQTVIDISTLPIGVYMVRLISDKTVRTGMFIKN